jgi:predicted TIM-barrel fold metal-dependent hydrolase
MFGMHRRDLFRNALVVSLTPLAGRLPAEGSCGPEITTVGDSVPEEMVDTNVSLGQWPFRRLALDETQLLIAKLRSLGISQAWAGTFEGLLHRDIRAVNDRLAAACEPYHELVPVGSLNLGLPDWEGDLERCLSVHAMSIIRVHPGYHGYDLLDRRFSELLRRAAVDNFLVQLSAAMEDTRTQHALVQVQDVDLLPLPQLMSLYPKAHVQLLNARLRGRQLLDLFAAPRLYTDIARAEGTDSVAELLRVAPARRVFFGSHAPFLIPEASMMRVYESGVDFDHLRGLLVVNAKTLFTSLRS